MMDYRKNLEGFIFDLGTAITCGTIPSIVNKYNLAGLMISSDLSDTYEKATHDSVRKELESIRTLYQLFSLRIVVWHNTSLQFRNHMDKPMFMLSVYPISKEKEIYKMSILMPPMGRKLYVTSLISGRSYEGSQMEINRFMREDSYYYLDGNQENIVEGDNKMNNENKYTHMLTAENTDRLKHEVAFNNPQNLNPDEMLNEILNEYFCNKQEC